MTVTTQVAIITALVASGGVFPSSAAMTADEKTEMLNQHNVYRCIHDVPLFTWDDDIAANAQAYADQGKFEHSPKPRVVNGVNVGENLAWGAPSMNHMTAVHQWWSEIVFTHASEYKNINTMPLKDQPFGLTTSLSAVSKNGKQQAVGHYTAVVWKDSTKVGCGKGRAIEVMYGQSLEGDLWVCQYSPGGNIMGMNMMEDNVVKPTKTFNEPDNCGSVYDEPCWSNYYHCDPDYRNKGAVYSGSISKYGTRRRGSSVTAGGTSAPTASGENNAAAPAGGTSAPTASGENTVAAPAGGTSAPTASGDNNVEAPTASSANDSANVSALARTASGAFIRKPSIIIPTATAAVLLLVGYTGLL